MEFEHVLVVGAGQMGGGIAQVLAASGRRVSLHDPFPGAVERGLAAIEKSLTRLDADVADVMSRIAPVDELGEADLLIEAITEDKGAKEDVFRRADGALPERAVLASNTSSIPITSLAAVTNRPDRVIGMHFFNPVPVLKLVEVVRGRETSDETAVAIVALAEDLGKTPAVANDFPGFVSRSSTTASTIRSAGTISSTAVTRRSTSSGSAPPFSASFSRLLRIVASPRSVAPG